MRPFGLVLGILFAHAFVQISWPATVPTMALFSSDRERRLWLWTLVVIVAIYPTLGIAPILAGVLREDSLLETSFALGMILVGATIVTQGVKVRPGGVEVAVASGVTAVCWLVFVRMEATPEERTHLIEYGV